MAEVVVDPNEPPEKAEEDAAAIVKAEEEKEKAETEVKLEHPRVPVIRVRLDEHVADVTVEDLVRLLSLSLSLGAPADFVCWDRR